MSDTHPKVQFDTNKGTVVIELNQEKAPVTVKNFLSYVESGFYDGVIFHRVIPDFMIQGGDPTGTGMGGPGYQFKDEIHPELNFAEPYKLAMANAGPGTNGSQFFITVAPTTWLQGRHTIFGEVADDASKKIVHKIAAVETAGQDRPVEDVVLTSVSIETL